MIVHDDATWMAGAARLSQRGRPLSRPNPSVACLIVRGGQVIARGWTQSGGRPHAEAMALAELAKRADGAAGATLYVTLEPCAHQSPRGPSCTDLLVATQPARVVIGQLDPDPRTAGNGAARLRAAGIAVDVLNDETARLALAGYFSRSIRNRPFITLKIAMSQDGFIARQPGEEQWITGPEARAHVHARRAKQDAILVGGETWRRDKPRLNVRLPGLEDQSPDRFVLTGKGHVTGARSIEMIEDVGQMEEVQYLYIEGGAQVANAFLKAGLIDQLDLYIAPVTIGAGTKAPGAILPAALADWQIVETCQLGSDHFTAYQRRSD